MPYGGNIHNTVGADLVQADVDSLVLGLGGVAGLTISDVHERLLGLEGLLAGTGGGVPATVVDRLDAGLFDNSYHYPLLQMLLSDLNSYLVCTWSSQTWMEAIHSAVNTGFHDMLYDTTIFQPWLQTINNSIHSVLDDWTNNRPWLETLDGRMASLLAILEDVHDPAQHALRTV